LRVRHKNNEQRATIFCFIAFCGALLLFAFLAKKHEKKKENVNAVLYFQKSAGTERAGCQAFWSEKILNTTRSVAQVWRFDIFLLQNPQGLGFTDRFLKYYFCEHFFCRSLISIFLYFRALALFSGVVVGGVGG